jgi:tripartite-type tricarboxylate transporter receptor subunit TctC
MVHCGTGWRGKKLITPIATLIFFLLAGTTTPILAAQRHSANIDERAVADFYRGKVVRIVVGFPPGGGADVYSRVLVRHLGRFIPGNPTLAVTNMPGAGSIIAGNHIFNAGAKDGKRDRYAQRRRDSRTVIR